MDSNKTEAKLSSQDSFYQVKGLNDRKSENTGYRVLSGTRTRAQHRQQWAKSHTPWDQNGRRGGYAQKAVSEITREFRVVRDNRMNQNTTKDSMLGSLQHSLEDNHQGTSNVQKISSSGKIIDHKHSAQGNSDGRAISQNLDGRCDSDPSHSKDEKSCGSEKASLTKEKQMTVSSSTRVMPKEVINKSQVHSETFASANTAIGVYSTSSDPVHVPSSRSAGPVGAIRCEFGVVGVRRRSFDHSAACTSTSGNSFAVPLSERDSASSRQSTTTSKINNPSSVSKPIIPSTFIRKPFSASQYDVKPHRQVMGRQKATWTNMAWKPKSSRKPTSDSPDATTQSGQFRAADLSEELLQVNICKNEHVIIPHHLRVPESEQAGLMFGSFGAECDSTKSFVSASREFKNEQESSNGQASSTSASIPVLFEDSVGDQSGPVDSQFRTSNDSVSDEAEFPLPINDESISPRDIESYPDIGLIRSHDDSYKSHEPQEQQGPPSLADFSAYDPQMSFDMPFSKMTMEDNAQGQGFSSTLEPQALSTHVTDGRSFSSMSLVQQQQPFTQLYQQVHISQYPNFAPYRQIISPSYVPQLLVPSYSTSSVPTHPSSGSNYFMMPGGSPQSTSGGMKYGPSQHKTVQSGTTVGYATYTNSGGYTIETIRCTAGMEDMTRISFEDNNLYVPNPQSDVDMWIQSPRDLASLQSTPCYSLSGQAQAQPHPAYLSGFHGVDPALNQVAFPSLQLQFPGLYQPSQHGSLAGQTNNIIHQQVHPGLAGNSGMGVAAAAAAQVGAYQPSQLGHLGWTNDY